LFCSKPGLTQIVACERTFRKIAENDLSEPIHASPAVSDSHLFIRTEKHLWCISG
jgi:hypothetical protein